MLFISKAQLSISLWGKKMFVYSLKITLRNLKKHKGISLINIAGLTIGVIGFILIGLFVRDELSYDRHHEKSGRIYRVNVRAVANNTEFYSAAACTPMAQALVTEFPEVEASTRLHRFGIPLVRYKDKVFSEERFWFADPTFFDVFTVPFLKGDPKTALTEPNSVVLTRSTAERYFGQDDPVGKTLNADRRRDYLVTGVVEDVPRTSHFRYDFLGSMNTFEYSRNQNWISNNDYTYFVLREAVTHREFEEKMQSLIEKYVYPQVKGALGVTPDEFIAGGGFFAYYIQPLTDIHLHSHLQHEIEANSDISYVYIFSVIALAILLISCVNFINLSTAQSATRAREVGIRKTVGSTANELKGRFIAEAVFLGLLAVVLSLPVIELLLPVFNNLTGKDLHIPYLTNALTLPFLLGIGLAVGLLAGVYPAFYLSSFHPVAVLKGEYSGKGKKSWMRNALVIFQFTVSIILIIGTFVVHRQLRYIQSRNLGFNRDQVVIIHKVDDLGRQFGAFKQELLSFPAIASAANTSDLMGASFGDDLFVPANRPQDQKQLIWRMWADPDFLATYKIELSEGNFFPAEAQDERRVVVLNEAAVKILGLESPVGQLLIDMEGNSHTIIGVVKDFHVESLHQPIKPFLIQPLGPGGGGGYLSVRMATGDIQKTLSLIEQAWRKYAGGQAFEYEFFDEHFARVYLSEQKTGRIFFIFSLLAVSIACLGLFGLTAFITEQRTKEIGIRKVLGASASQVLLLLTRQFALLVLAANLIAWPVAYWISRNWLQDFAYRTNLTVWVFVLSTGLALAVALLTVSVQSVRAALANPVDSLRYE
jgi:putative ABC transport system permease protein